MASYRPNSSFCTYLSTTPYRLAHSVCRLAKDYERLQANLIGMRLAAFICLLLHRAAHSSSKADNTI